LTAEPIRDLGRRTTAAVQSAGGLGVFSGRAVSCLITPPFRLRRLANEVYDIGVLSLLIICISGLTVGAVLGLQGYTTLARFGATTGLGSVVGLVLIRELGPVLTALLVTGRAGSAIAAEIGSMVATEQLDGLRMMSVDPVHFVVTPKAVAMVIAMPLLSALFIVFGLGGGYLVGVFLLGVDGGSYLSGLEGSITFRNDVLGSFVKSLVFGVLVGLISTYRGFTAVPNAEGVSRATTSTVVIASVATLVFDYIITALWGVV
jgi:phospholipid/cholesterol/gamma-HCH transport system permease protein